MEVYDFGLWSIGPLAHRERLSMLKLKKLFCFSCGKETDHRFVGYEEHAGRVWEVWQCKECGNQKGVKKKD